MPAKKTETTPPRQQLKNKIEPSSPAICLLGFMGAGKSWTAEALAVKLNADYIDLDEFIEARENRRVAQIIENLGEKVFREIETDALREVLQPEVKKIIALGGGAWTIEENREIIKHAGYQTIWLDAPFDLCWHRIAEAGASRPLARQKTETRRLFNARREIYQTAEFRLKISKAKAPQDIAVEIIKLILPASPKRVKSIDKKPRSR